MQLSPNSLIPVSYTTSIPGDTTLYFVQAVLRDTQSGKTLQTLNLTNVSSTPNRYQGSFSPVSDPSGLGRAVDVTISVYTDSGHTTLSPNYQILQLNYVILQPWIQNFGMGGGMNIDYVKLQEMFDGSRVGNEEIGNEVARKVKRTKVDYDKIDEMVGSKMEKNRSSLSSELKGHATNLSKIMSDALSAVSGLREDHNKNVSDLGYRIKQIENKIENGQSVSSKEIGSIREGLKSLSSDVSSSAKSTLDKSTGEHSKKIEETMQKVVSEFQEYLHDNLSEKEIKIQYTPTSPKKEEKKTPQFAPEHIASLLH